MDSGEQPANALDLVKAYFAAAQSGDADALVALLAEDAKIHVPASLPYGGTHTGANGFKQAMAGFANTWAQSESSEFQYIAQGSTVVVVSRMQAKARATGRDVDCFIAELFVINNNRIEEVRPFYFDTASLADASIAARSSAPEKLKL